MNKKGSLNLSIQAIVVLVMAMALLGLGLGFIRTLMGQGQEQFEDAIANAKLTNPATADKTITINPTITVKQGKMTTVEIGVYNNGETTGEIELELENDNTNCPAATSKANDKFTLESLAQSITIGEAGGFLAPLHAGKDLDTDTTYICSVKVKDTSLSKQFFVRVVA